MNPVYYNTAIEMENSNALSVGSYHNDTGNSTEITEKKYGTEVVVPLAIFLCVVMVLTLVGNSMVILTIKRHKGMRTRTNMFITNLAISDILTAIFDMPVSLVTLIERSDEPLLQTVDALCQFNGFTMALFLMTSIHTLMYISIYKCISITRPFSRFMTKRRILYMIMGTWLWSFSYATAAVIGWNRSVFKPGATQCGPSIPDNFTKMTHSLVNTTFNFVVPFAILSICYSLMFREIRNHMDRMRETSSMDNRNSVMQQKRIAVTLFMVMACFVFCLTPYVVYSSYAAFSKDKNSVPTVFNPLSYWFIYANCACNPIIYAFRSPSFRQGYKEIMCGQTMHYLSGGRLGMKPGSFRSNSQRNWSFRSSVKAPAPVKVIRRTLPAAKEQIKSVASPQPHANGSPPAIAAHLSPKDDDSSKNVDVEGQNATNAPAEAMQLEEFDKVEIIVTENGDHILTRSSNNINLDNKIVITAPSHEDSEDDDIDVDSLVQENGQVESKMNECQADGADEAEDIFYDSDVEMEDRSHQRRKRVPKRRESKSMFVPKNGSEFSGAVCRHLVGAQTKLMNIDDISAEKVQISRARSFSDVYRLSNVDGIEPPANGQKKKELPNPFIWQPSVDKLDVPRQLNGKYSSQSAGNLIDMAKSPSLSKKLSALFSRSKEKSMDKLIKTASDNKLDKC